MIMSQYQEYCNGWYQPTPQPQKQLAATSRAAYNEPISALLTRKRRHNPVQLWRSESGSQTLSIITVRGGRALRGVSRATIVNWSSVRDAKRP
ncbi:hypothetical protein VTO73DRAFT_8554 [Trametes versicolor]